MRVQLPAGTPASGPEKPALTLASPTPAASSPPPAAVPAIASPASAAPGNLEPAVTARPLSRGERLVNLVASRAVVLPAVLFCTALFGWSLLIRLPEQKRLLAVTARELPTPSPSGANVTESSLATLREQITQVSPALIGQSDEIGPILSRLEAIARTLGWRVEVTIKPAVPAPHGIQELTLHPVRIELSSEPGQTRPGHLRLLTWMREISSLDKRVEVSGLKLQSSGGGLDEAYVDLRIHSLNSHEEAAAK